MPKVSIIVPMYAAKQYIVPCVLSLRRQGLSDMEILLVDDCSPDDTYHHAKELFRGNETVRVLQTKKNGGPGFARNLGMEEAAGEYICFCDVDDIYVDGSISEMLKVAKRLYADVYSSDAFYVTVAEAPLPEDLHELKEENLLKLGCITPEDALSEGRIELAGAMEERLEQWLGHRYHWSVCGKLFRAAFLRKEGIRFPAVSIGEDHLFMLKALLRAKVYANEVRAPYIARTGSNVQSVSRNRKDPGIFIRSMRSILMAPDIIDDCLGVRFPAYRKRLTEFHIRAIEECFAVQKYKEIGREKLSRNKELKHLFYEFFGEKGDFVKKTLLDAYEARPAGLSLEDCTQYECLKALKEATGEGLYSLLS